MTMIDTVIILSFLIAGAGIGFFGIDFLPADVLAQVNNREGLSSATGGFGALIGLVAGLACQTSYRRIEAQVRQMPADRLLTRSGGVVLGLLMANLMLAPLYLLPFPWELAFIKPLIAVLGSVVFAVTGVSLADTHGRSFLRLINPNSVESILVSEGTLAPAAAKVVDTSCIIDGRLTALLDTGFIEGRLIVPQFVLQELQRIADSASDQKRSRGRRGLDILQQMREAHPDRLAIHSADYDDITTVDAKLVRLAQEINGALLTTDYNLNKVATVQNVPVLNVNDLADALRPAYLPGDSLDLKIVREGKEPAQGVGYLSDGTMVVVEDGNAYLGGELRVVVTSALQTSAGRMIFAKRETAVS